MPEEQTGELRLASRIEGFTEVAQVGMGHAVSEPFVGLTKSSFPILRHLASFLNLRLVQPGRSLGTVALTLTSEGVGKNAHSSA
jgi:hypothetical protein